MDGTNYDEEEEGMLKEHNGFKAGDECALLSTDDVGAFGHLYRMDDILTLIHFDPSDDSWWVRWTDGSVRPDLGEDHNWVAEEELKFVHVLTDNEVQAAIQSILNVARS